MTLPEGITRYPVSIPDGAPHTVYECTECGRSAAGWAIIQHRPGCETKARWNSATALTELTSEHHATPTAEERAAWRTELGQLSSWEWGTRIGRLLDALERASAIEMAVSALAERLECRLVWPTRELLEAWRQVETALATPPTPGGTE